MKVLTIVLLIVYNIIFLYNIIKKKDFFGLGTIVNFSIVFNFILYLFRWSKYITEEPYIGTYIIIDSILIVFILVMLFSKSPIDALKESDGEIRLIPRFITIFKRKLDIYLLINIVYILLFLTENYLGSKNLAPYLYGKDIHTYSAPIISFVTRALFVIVILNYLCYKSFLKKRFLILILIDLSLFIVLRGARMNVFMAMVQFCLFYAMYHYKTIINNKKILVTIVMSLFLFVAIGVFIGNRRVDKSLQGNKLHGKVKYSDFIRYSGPKDPIGVMPWYYGYFPMSFSNLNLTIKNIDNNNIKTYGVYTLRPILVGLFEMDNFIPNYKDIKYANSLAKYHTTAASVRTGFMEFYLDFGYFAIIGIAIYAFIGLYFYNKIRINKYFTVFYALYGGCWFFMSFQNSMIDVTTLYSLIYLYLIYRFFVDKNSITL